MSTTRETVKTKKLDKRGLAILEKLEEGQFTDKEIANKFNVDLAVVKMIRKYHVKSSKPNVTNMIISTVKCEKKKDDTKNSNIETPATNTKEKDNKVHCEKEAGNKWSDDTRLEIASLIDDGLTAKEIVKKLGVSKYIVYKTARMFDLNFAKPVEVTTNDSSNTEKESNNEVKEETTTVQEEVAVTKEEKEVPSDNENKDYFTIVPKGQPVVHIGVLENDCFDSNVNKFIFGASFAETEKWNFKNQRAYAFDRIHQFIDHSDKIFNERVKLYLSTVDSFNISVILALMSLNINADVVLSNNTRNMKCDYTINDRVKTSNYGTNSHIRFQIKNNDECYLYGMKDARQVNEHYYTINRIDYDLKNEQTKRTSYIFNDITDTWKYFSKFVSESMSIKGKVNVNLYIDEVFDNKNKNGKYKPIHLASHNNYNNYN